MLQELTAEIEATARAVANDIHTALPGEVVSYDAGKCTATVKPVGKFTTSDGTELDYPTITEAPVLFPFCQNAGVGMVFPVKKGDSCLIIISEVELDAWRSGAEPEGPLRFDLTSAVIIPGLMEGGSGASGRASRDNAVVITAGDTELSVSDSGVRIKGDLTVDGTVRSKSG